MNTQPNAGGSRRKSSSHPRKRTVRTRSSQKGAAPARLHSDNAVSAQAIEEIETHQWRLAKERLPILIWSVDQELTITSSSGAGLKAIGLESGQLIGTNLRDFLATRNDSSNLLEYYTVALRGEPVSFEISWADRHLQVQLEPLRRTDGSVNGCVGIAFDDTERLIAEIARQRMESRMKDAQRLESIGVLAGGIAHDFNNLLGGILGFADLALNDLPANATARPLLEQVVAAARRASEVAKQLLAYAGKSRFAMETICPSALVRDMMELLKISIPKRSELRLELADGGTRIEGDSAQLRQVLMNVVMNAAEAIGDAHGIIAVRSRVGLMSRDELSKFELGAELPAAEYLVLEVSDTGCGMDEPTRAHIFNPFFTTKPHGRGLGLAVVIGIVRAHHGAIRVISEPGSGTTFQLVFPTSARSIVPVTSVTACGDGRAGESRSILVVDDEEAIRNSAKFMLEAIGHEVLVAVDGRHALDVYNSGQGRVDLVLLDLNMPRSDGVETFHQLRQFDPSLRVVIASGYGEKEAQDRLGGESGVYFIGKPYGLSELQSILSEALS